MKNVAFTIALTTQTTLLRLETRIQLETVSFGARIDNIELGTHRC